ncbi:MAG: thiamine phosphate synthase [Actinomycetota bacterium]
MSGPSRAAEVEAARRRERLAAARLYLVTDARDVRGDLAEFLEAVLGAGVDIVQLREKEAEAGDILRWSEVFRDAADRHDALFVVNDRADVALAADADGVHVGQNDLSPVFVRDLVGPDVLIGLSTHDDAQLRASPLEADYVCVGPIHETPTKPGRPPTGLELVRIAAPSEPRPWFAIGGIDPSTLPDVVAAGARRIVVVRAVTEAPNAAAAVRGLLDGLPAAPVPTSGRPLL